jgi:hypothetical protein
MRISKEVAMKPTDLIPLINGWAFAAFVIAIGAWLYFSRRDKG